MVEFNRTDRGVCTDGFTAYGFKDGKYGLALIKADRVCTAVGVFTKNSVQAAHVILDKPLLKGGLQAIAANSGNANACMPEGLKDARRIQKAAAKALGVSPKNLAVASTGIIGRRIDASILEERIRHVAPRMSPDGSMEAATAIMTTDKTPKQYSIEYGGIQVGGICKGAGMIAPNMATMLCFITTNADLERGTMQKALNEAVEDTFNMITVEGDMSTNDTVIVMSTRKKKCSKKIFLEMLREVSREISKMIVRDAEGATKFIEFNLTGARSAREAREAAKAVVNSPLVKTAFYGENPNWGRIIAAIGARIKVDYRKVDLTFRAEKESVQIVKKGVMGDLEKAKAVMKSREITVDCNLNCGKHKATAWSCDLTEEYVRINAGYN